MFVTGCDDPNHLKLLRHTIIQWPYETLPTYICEVSITVEIDKVYIY